MVYRNVYITKYKRVPLHLFNGNDTLFYYDSIKFIKNIPADYNNKIDLLIDCDCQYTKWRKIEKVFK